MSTPPKPKDLVQCEMCLKDTPRSKSFLVWLKAKYWCIVGNDKDKEEKYLCADCGITEFRKGRFSLWFFTPYAATKVRKYEREKKEKQTA